MGIAVNRCRTWLSQRGRRPELLEYLQDTVAVPELDDSAELLREIQAGVVNELRFEYRTVFVMYHEQGQPYEEIAVGPEQTGRHHQDLAASGPAGGAGTAETTRHDCRGGRT